MSFGYSVGDFLLLTQLAYRTAQNARKACGAHDDLAREVSSLHIVLQRVEVEVSKPDSILNKTEDNRRKELERLARHCERVLKVLEQILDKYNALPDEKRSVTKLWQKVKFGNGEMLDLENIRSELATHTQALNMFLNLLSIGSQGKVERYMDTHGEELREIKQSLHWVAASMQASSHDEKSVLTSYGEDDKAIWKAFRRELIEEGISSHVLDKHKMTIKKYVIELGERGALDEPDQNIWQEATRTPTDRLSGSLPYPSPSATTGTIKTASKTEDMSRKEDEGERRSDQESPVPLPHTPVATWPINSESSIYQDSGSGQLPLYKAPRDLPRPHGSSADSTLLGTKVYLSEDSPQPRIACKTSGSAPYATVEDIEDEDFVHGAHPNCDEFESTEVYATKLEHYTDNASQNVDSDIEKFKLPRKDFGSFVTKATPDLGYINTCESEYQADNKSGNVSISDESATAASVIKLTDFDPGKVHQDLIDPDGAVHSVPLTISDDREPSVSSDSQPTWPSLKGVPRSRTTSEITAWGSASEGDDPGFPPKSETPMLALPRLHCERFLLNFLDELDLLDRNMSTANGQLTIVKESKVSLVEEKLLLKEFVSNAKRFRSELKDEVQRVRNKPEDNPSRSWYSDSYEFESCDVNSGRLQVAHRYHDKIVSINRYFRENINPCVETCG